MDTIKEFQGEYRWLSNFYPVNINLLGIVYPSVENAYQAAKSNDPKWKLRCINITPGTAKREGRKQLLIPQWEAVRVDIMRTLLIHKFWQEPFSSLLLATEDRQIEEGNTWGDTFWGIDLRTGRGSNMLGKLIMQIRADKRTINQAKRDHDKAIR